MDRLRLEAGGDGRMERLVLWLMNTPKGGFLHLSRRWVLGFSLVLLTLGQVGAVEWPHQPGSGAQLKTFTPEITLSWPPGTPVAYKQARLWLDDREVGPDLIKTSLFLSYRPREPLQRGTHRVRVEVGEHRQDWEFEVIGAELIKGHVFKVVSPTHVFDPIDVEVQGVPRGKAWATLEGFPEKYDLKESKRGVYRGRFKTPARMAGKTARVEVFLRKDDQLDRQFCDSSISVAAPNLQVDWVSPAPASSVEAEFVAEGKTLPEHPVEVATLFFFRDGVAFGKLPPESVTRLHSDGEGRFRVSVAFPKGLPRLGVRLLALVKDEQDNRSPLAELILLQAPRGGLPPLKTTSPSVR